MIGSTKTRAQGIDTARRDRYTPAGWPRCASHGAVWERPIRGKETNGAQAQDTLPLTWRKGKSASADNCYHLLPSDP